MPRTASRVVPELDGLSGRASRYDAMLVDLWGCLHNGVDALPSAVDALIRFRERGGRVVLLSNAPRTGEAVRRQLAAMDVPDDAWDHIMTAGLALRLEMAERADAWFASLGRRFFHIGRDRDADLLDGLDYAATPADAADFVLCSGIRRNGETLDGIMPELAPALARGLPMVSANPDRFVLRGDVREICAGAIAEAYRERGGEIRQEGKPYPAVYRRCRDLLDGLPAARILAVGDGIETDIAGARGAGIDAIWITGGLPAHFWGIAPDDRPPQNRVAESCARHGVAPLGVMPLLRW